MMALSNCTSSWEFFNQHKKYKPNYCKDRGGKCLDFVCFCCQCNKITQTYDYGAKMCVANEGKSSATTYITNSRGKNSSTSSLTYTTLGIPYTTAFTEIIVDDSSGTNIVPIIVGILVALFIIIALIIFVVCCRRKRRRESSNCRENLQLHLVAQPQVEHTVYEQINKDDVVDSPAYVYVEANANGVTGHKNNGKGLPSSPYSYVDPNKITTMVGTRGSESKVPDDSVQSPVYFTLEEEQDNQYASTELNANPPENASSEPYYLELKEEGNGGYLEPEKETGKYKELTHAHEKNTYQSLLKDEIPI